MAVILPYPGIVLGTIRAISGLWLTVGCQDHLSTFCTFPLPEDGGVIELDAIIAAVHAHVITMHPNRKVPTAS